MTESQQPNPGQPQQVNLQEIAQQFMAGLQRHFDMLAFNLAARESVTEEAYDRFAQAPKIMPAAQRHQNFEQMQAYARDLLQRQIVGDCMNLAVTGLNNAHFFLALVKATKANTKVTPEAQKAAKGAQQAFVGAQLDAKFNKLEKDYGIMCELEDTVTSLGFCLQALLQHGGIVQPAQLDDNGELLIDLKMLKVLPRSEVEGKRQGKLVDQRLVYREGDLIRFDDEQLQRILVTVAAFADALFKSVSHYARNFKDGAAD